MKGMSHDQILNLDTSEKLLYKASMELELEYKKKEMEAMKGMGV